MIELGVGWEKLESFILLEDYGESMCVYRLNKGGQRFIIHGESSVRL